MTEWKTSEKITAIMQFALTVLFTFGYFFITAVVLFGRAEISPEQMRLADTLFGILSAVLVQQSGYWFSRQRGQDYTESDLSTRRNRYDYNEDYDGCDMAIDSEEEITPTRRASRRYLD